VIEQGGPGGREVRRERRVATDLPATIGLRPSAHARVVDLSLAGCLVRCDGALDAGEVVDLRLELPDGPLRVKARVADASLDGAAPAGTGRSLAGLEFLGLAAVDEPRLRGYLTAESRRSAGADEASS
jgi:PilZ domain